MNSRHHWRVPSAALGALALAAVGVAGVGSPAQAAQTRHVLPGGPPTWAVAAADRGPSTSPDVTARVYLAGQDPAGLARYAAAVSDPASPDYRHYLSGDQVQSRFGPSTTQVSAVTSWLHTAGLAVTATTPHYLAVRGGATAVQRAFGTRLDEFAVRSTDYRAPVSALSVPASVAGDVLSVDGLADAPQRTAPNLDDGGGRANGSTGTAGPETVGDPVPTAGTAPVPTDAPPAPAFVNAGPFSTYYGSNTATTLPAVDGAHVPYAVQGYVGSDLRAAYGAPAGATGAGTRVAVIAAYASPTIVADTTQYADRNGVAWKPGQFGQLTPTGYNDLTGCEASTWFDEQSLDVEAVHAAAPSAKVTLVSSASCHLDDQIDSVAKVVDGHLADVVSDSWSSIDTVTPALQQAFDQLFQQGAAEGIGFVYADGDNGDKGDLLNGVPDFPGRDPWVTSVGGTTLAVGPKRTYEWETGWGTNVAPLSADGSTWVAPPGAFSSGTGGGVVTGEPQPSYQAGVVPNTLSEAGGASTPQRVIPDIAADADPATGLLIGDTMQFPDGSARYNQHRIGGTSLATPLIAGLEADAQQLGGGTPIGFANPALYALARTPVWHDPNGNPLGDGTDPAQVRVDFNNSADAGQGTTTTLRTTGPDTSLVTTPGYDDTTGLGTPTTAFLLTIAHPHG